MTAAPSTVTVPAAVTGSCGSSSASVPVPSKVNVSVARLKSCSAMVRTMSQAASRAIDGAVVVGHVTAEVVGQVAGGDERVGQGIPLWVGTVAREPPVAGSRARCLCEADLDEPGRPVDRQPEALLGADRDEVELEVRRCDCWSLPRSCRRGATPGRWTACRRPRCRRRSRRSRTPACSRSCPGAPSSCPDALKFVPLPYGPWNGPPPKNWPGRVGQQADAFPVGRVHDRSSPAPGTRSRAGRSSP